MALKDLLVCLDQTQGASKRLHLAADLARRHSCRLTALYVREWNTAQLEQRSTTELALASAKDVESLDRGTRASIDATVEELRSTLHTLSLDHGLQTEWRCLDGATSHLAPQQARYADLCILGNDVGDEDTSIGSGFFEQMLFLTGRPQVFIPALTAAETLGRHVVVAWNASRAATRALNDALPLIERADRTTVLIINPAESPDLHPDRPGERIVEHLNRHGATVDALVIENVQSASIADTLQVQARALGADLLVSGTFGHSKFREQLLGGVTRDLLDRMSLPVLMSH